MSTPSVYISSTFEDLKEYRAAVFEALEKAGFQVGRMEGYAASDERPLDVCLQDVESRDIYVGIFAWRYGYIPPKEHGNEAGLSISECEYRRAVARDKPTLCFFHDPKAAAQWPDKFKDEVTGKGESGARIRALRDKLGTEKMVDFFRSPYELAARVLAAIVRHGTVRRPFTVPVWPEGLVPRAQVTGAIVAALLSDERTPLAIHGGGGFGKTTLGIAVCHAPEVIKAFPDGTVWVTLGEKHPEVERNLAEIYRALTGNTPATTSVAGIGAEVRNYLSGKRCLIVVDDVWSDAHLKSFRDLGAHRLMFTTRKRELAAERAQIEVQEMTTEEGVQLLVRGMPEAATHLKAVEDFAAELGGWALLLELANTRLISEKSRRGSFEAAFDYLTKVYRERGVTGFDRKNAEERNEAVVRCLDAGLEAFEKTLPTLKSHAGELGLFPEDTPIPEPVLCELWHCDKFTLEEDTLRHLDDVSVVRWDVQKEFVRLHDSVRAALATWVPDRKASHRRLLEAWSDPMQLPHEYAWRWYGWHCLEAGDPERLRNLLLNPAWLQAKLDHTDVVALIADCERLEGEGHTAARDLDSTAPTAALPDTQDLTIRLLGDALRKSAHVLGWDPSQLQEQLFGRLRPGMSPELDAMNERLRDASDHLSLRARFPNLEPAGSPLLYTFAETKSAAYGALLLRDGKTVLTWWGDGMLRLWNLDTGQPIGVPLIGHKDWVGGALLLPDEKRAMSWSGDGTLRLWDLQTQNQVGEPLAGHEQGVGGGLLLPDGKRALSWAGHELRLWDLEMNQSIGKPLTGAERGVSGVLLLPEPTHVLSWTRDHFDGTLRLWDLQTQNQVGEPLAGHEQGVNGVLLLPGGKRALSWSSDSTLRLWDLGMRQQLGAPLIGHKKGVNGVLLLPDGKRALSWSSDSTLRLWDLDKHKQIGKPLAGHSDQVIGALLLSRRGRVLSWSADETLRLWDLDNHQQIGEPLTGHLGVVNGALLLPGEGRALSWSEDGKLRLWDLTTSGQIGEPLTGHESNVRSALLLPDGRRVLSWSEDRTLRLWSLPAVESVKSPLTGHGLYVKGALRLPSRGQVLSWSDDRTLRLWDLSDRKPAGTPLNGHTERINGALLLADGMRALSWSSDKTLRVWDLETCTQTGAPFKGDECVKGALLLPDGRRVLSWSFSGVMQLWELETGTQIGATFRMQHDSVSGVLLLHDRRLLCWLLSRMWLWDLDTRKHLGDIVDGHQGPVNGALLLAEERQALSWSGDGTLRLWDLETRKPAAEPLRVHAGVVGVILLPDGNRVLSWSGRTLMLSDLKRRTQIGLLAGHKRQINGALVVPRCERVLSWSHDRTVRLWDLTTSEEISCYYADGGVTTVIDCGENGFFAGDRIGRVYFLELVEP